MKYIEDMKDLCNYFCADEPASLNRRIYKDTACGASISVELPSAFLEWDDTPASTWVHNGDQAWNYLTMDDTITAFTIQSIVEGSDATVDSAPFALPASTEEVSYFMEYMEAETSRLWDEANDDDWG